jgi:hypothetical protein
MPMTRHMDGYDVSHDPYRRCEQACNHDLARGVSLDELLGRDGPHPDSHLIVSFSLQHAVVLDEDDERQGPIAATG